MTGTWTSPLPKNCRSLWCWITPERYPSVPCPNLPGAQEDDGSQASVNVPQILLWALTFHWSLQETQAPAMGWCTPTLYESLPQIPHRSSVFYSVKRLCVVSSVQTMPRAGPQPYKAVWALCSAHSRSAIASVGGDLVSPREAGALLGRAWGWPSKALLCSGFQG